MFIKVIITIISLVILISNIYLDLKVLGKIEDKELVKKITPVVEFTILLSILLVLFNTIHMFNIL